MTHSNSLTKKKTNAAPTNLNYRFDMGLKWTWGLENYCGLCPLAYLPINFGIVTISPSHFLKFFDKFSLKGWINTQHVS